jgi:hypothetical protein
MARTIEFSFPAADADGICASQTLAGAGALTIDGALLDRAATMRGVTRVKLPGIQRVVSLTSAGNLAAVNFTVTGYDLFGKAVTQTLAGPNANTVATSEEFHIITGVSADDAVGSAVTVGTGSTGRTNWAIVDRAIQPTSINIALTLTATISVTVKETFDDVNAKIAAGANPTTQDDANLAAETTSATGTITAPIAAWYAAINSSSGDGAATVQAIQAGIAGP